MKRVFAGFAMLALAAGPALAGAKEGVAAWQRGDYAAAIAQWQPAAAAGDADAEFDLAQAYKLGRGVPQDLGQAQNWYYKAAQQGHPQAEANYGLTLFQNGDRTGAMPWLQKAALQGEPHAQYVAGTALFNGDLAGKDWPRAYAYMTRAAAAGLPQAANSLAQMDQLIPLPDRQRGIKLAQSLAQPTPFAPVPDGAPAATPATASGTPGIASTALPPSGAAGDQVAAGEPASAPATGKGRKAKDSTMAFAEPAPVPTANFGAPASPAEAPPMTAAMPAPVPTSMRGGEPAPLPARVAATPKKAPRVVHIDAAADAGGKWRLQLGAYGNAAGANAAWKTASRAPGLAGLDHYAVSAGAVTRLQAGAFASRAAATRACVAAKAGGANCFVVAAP